MAILPALAMAAAGLGTPLGGDAAAAGAVAVALVAAATLPAEPVGVGVRAAAWGTGLFVVARIAAQVLQGGVIALGDVLAPALVTLCAYVAATWVGRVWRVIWGVAIVAEA